MEVEGGRGQGGLRRGTAWVQAEGRQARPQPQPVHAAVAAPAGPQQTVRKQHLLLTLASPHPVSPPPQEGLELIDVPDNIQRLSSFLRTTTGEREGLAALAAQAGGPSALMRSITAEMQVGRSFLANVAAAWAGWLQAGWAAGLQKGLPGCRPRLPATRTAAAAAASFGSPPPCLPARPSAAPRHAPALSWPIFLPLPACPPAGPCGDAGAHAHHHC